MMYLDRTYHPIHGGSVFTRCWSRSVILWLLINRGIAPLKQPTDKLYNLPPKKKLCLPREWFKTQWYRLVCHISHPGKPTGDRLPRSTGWTDLMVRTPRLDLHHVYSIYHIIHIHTIYIYNCILQCTDGTDTYSAYLKTKHTHTDR